MRWERGVIIKHALEDSNALLEIQQGACNSCSSYQGAICYCSKCAEVPFLSVRVTVACIFFLCVQCIFILHEQENTFHMTIEAVKHSLYSTNPSNWDMGRATPLCKKPCLLSCKERQPYSKMTGWICCHLSFALLRPSIVSIRS